MQGTFIEGLTLNEVERLLFVIYATYEQHPSEFDYEIIRKLREYIHNNDLPFTDLSEFMEVE